MWVCLPLTTRVINTHLSFILQQQKGAIVINGHEKTKICLNCSPQILRENKAQCKGHHALFCLAGSGRPPPTGPASSPESKQHQQPQQQKQQQQQRWRRQQQQQQQQQQQSVLPSKPPARDSGVSPKTQKVASAAARGNGDDDVSAEEATEFDFNPRKQGRSFMDNGSFIAGLKDGSVDSKVFMSTLAQYVKDFAEHAADNMDEEKIFNRFVVTMANVGIYSMLSSGTSEAEVKKIIAMCFERSKNMGKAEFAALIDKRGRKDSKK